MASPSCPVMVMVVVMVMGVSAFPSHPINVSAPFSHPEPRVTFDTSCRCGQKAGSRIVGGVQTEVNEWPWMVALTTSSYQFCGGSLINDRYVLTAAHCTEVTTARSLQGFRAGDIIIRLAEHNLATNGDTQLVTRTVSQIIDHPNYESGTEKNDISLLKLSSPVKVSSTILPVCMPPPRPHYTNKKATVTGWGTLSSGGSSPSSLREVEVTVMSNADCQQGYGSSIIDSMLCAGDSGKDSCQGDSGGPLVFRDAADNYDQIGVVSWGYGCAAPRYPGVYTRVNKYLNWIKANTGDGVYCAGMKL